MSRARPPARLSRHARFAFLLGAIACSREPEQSAPPPEVSVSRPAKPPAAPPPKRLYLPDAANTAPDPVPGRVEPRWGLRRCPPDMVSVQSTFCIDRYESSLVDASLGRPISPYYPPVRRLAARNRGMWEKKRHEMGDERAQMMPTPSLALWQVREEYEPVARSVPDVVPNGYVSGNLAETACVNAGKRLCTESEWETACRGESDRQFPYGAEYEGGACNVFREAHPAMVLHDNPSIGHTDPRLNLVKVRGKPLLRKTGATETCASRWGNDAVYDMVGNLDEWVSDPDGVFRGGFFSRSAKEGCDKRVASHERAYSDYSTGVRCCR